MRRSVSCDLLQGHDAGGRLEFQIHEVEIFSRKRLLVVIQHPHVGSHRFTDLHLENSGQEFGRPSNTQW